MTMSNQQTTSPQNSNSSTESADNRFQVTVYDRGGDELVRESITEQYGLFSREEALELALDIAHRRYNHYTGDICVWPAVPTDKLLASEAIGLFVPGIEGRVLLERL